MANSLRAKLSKLRHDGHITNTEYMEFMKKLDGHDRVMQEKVIDTFAEKLYDKSTNMKDIESEDYGLLHYEDMFKVAEEYKKELVKEQGKEIEKRIKKEERYS